MIYVDNKNSFRRVKIILLVCRNGIRNGILPVIDGSEDAYELYYTCVQCARLQIHSPKSTERTNKKIHLNKLENLFVAIITDLPLF